VPGVNRSPVTIMTSLLLITLAAWSGRVSGVDGEVQCADGSAPVDGRCVEEPATAQEVLPPRVTPFRARSMMPGHVDEPPRVETPAKALPGKATSMPRAEPGSGYGVQIGVFSERATAAKVARQLIEEIGGDFRLAPLERGSRILWACIHGPFADTATAKAALGRIRSETTYQEAFVKPLDQLKLIEPRHASTEE